MSQPRKRDQVEYTLLHIFDRTCLRYRNHPRLLSGNLWTIFKANVIAFSNSDINGFSLRYIEAFLNHPYACLMRMSKGSFRMIPKDVTYLHIKLSQSHLLVSSTLFMLLEDMSMSSTYKIRTKKLFSARLRYSQWPCSVIVSTAQ